MNVPTLSATTVETFDPWDGEPTGTERVWVLEYRDDLRVEYVDHGDAVKALRSVAEAHFDERVVFTCTWGVERWVPEPDSPADLIGECGAPAIEDTDGLGWHCLAGHGHRSNVEYYDDEEVAGARATRTPLAANAALMDGTPVS